MSWIKLRPSTEREKDLATIMYYEFGTLAWISFGVLGVSKGWWPI